MRASETRIDRFLATSDTAFVIPVYQRNYDWTRRECQQLLNDIIWIGESEGNAHFIGSIVYVHDDVYSATELNELIIIDGQQRLTTITLIYISLYQFALQINDINRANQIHKKYLINEFASETEKLKLKPTENNLKAFRHILNSEKPADFQGYSHVIENYILFKNEINESNYESVWKGLAKLVFIDIALDRTKDNAQRIFESLNSTGLDLSQADLIRNYILMDLKRHDQNKIYQNYWEVIETLAKDGITPKISDFIRDFLTLKNKEIPNKKDVYSIFKSKYPTTTLKDLETMLSELKSLAKFYNRLLNPEHETDKEIRRQLLYIHQLEINVAYPFLMKVYEDYENRIIDKDTFIAVLELIQSFVWRRFIVGLPTNALNKIFMSLYEKVAPENYLYSIQKSLVSRFGAARFPKNNEITNLLKDKDVYNIKSKNRIYLLERLENFDNKELVSIENLTIEHIFPQNPDPKWKEELGNEEYNFIKENYLHTVGNITLSGNNGKLANKPFVEKRDMNFEDKEQGYKFSRLWLNRDLKAKDAWNKEEITKRAKIITERFLKVWSYPDIIIGNNCENEDINIFDAEDPTNKKIEYAIFLGQRINPLSMSEFYISIMQMLFDSQPERFTIFIDSEIGKKIKISKNETVYNNRNYAKLNDTYFILTNTSSSDKFEKIKTTLEYFALEDELTIKYKDNSSE
ncbi:MAG: DUF262 domain-containing HNH endonuclease family protein [Tannerellaceae bacterium]|jgi:uncharacterized protein with ParB-like and HNH nuclease domain|nr:DUF262 domain-containing HNH endonuclease family protein [Tannerellaceae bacterium]